MQSKLSDLVDKLSEIINKVCKTYMERKNIKSECKFIEFQNNRLQCRCKECKGTSTKPINGLIEKFSRMYQFCDCDLNKFVFVLRKGVYPYEYMDSWERFNEISLPDKKYFYSELNSEDISDKDHLHAQKVFCTDIGDYHDLYVQCDTLLLADVFEKFRDTCTEIYGLDPSHFWQTYLKKKQIKI